MNILEEEKSYKYRKRFIVWLFLAVMCAYVIQLVNWQLVNGAKYRELANNSNAYVFKTEAIRGEIVDVNGIGFAVNDTGYSLYFDKINYDKDKINSVILNLIELTESRKEKWVDLLPITSDGSDLYTFVEDKDNLVTILKSKSVLDVSENATANECMNKLIDKYQCESFSKDEQRKIISVRFNMTLTGFDSSYTTPYIFAKKVSPELVSIVLENSDKYPGVKVTTSSNRKCLNGTVAPHIIGSVGALTKEDYEELKSKGYSYNDKKGKDGIEEAMESELRGKGGKKYVEVNRKGSTEMRVLETQNAQPGHTVFLTLDAKLQKIATESIIRNVQSIGGNCKAGGVVALDVRDFSVLVAASCPGYDLNKYLNEDGYYSKLLNDSTKPLIDRAFGTGFAPGSTFKPAVACAALQEGKISQDSTFYCNHGYMNIRCTGSHANIAVENALRVSCNAFFMQAGKSVGIDILNYYCKKLGLGVKTGIEIPESAGTLAGRQIKEKRGEDWTLTDTLQASLGQSENLFTPLQMATMTATIANGGHRYKTHFIRKVTDYGRDNVIWENDPNKPILVEETGISPTNLDIVKSGMRKVVTGGTAAGSIYSKVAVAGKTGTAETNFGSNKTFICYAPYDKPEIAIAVMLEHAGDVSRPMFNVVNDILAGYFDGSPSVELEK